MQLCGEYSRCFDDRGMFVVIHINNISFRGKVCRCQYETVRKRIKMVFNKDYYLNSTFLM